MKTNIWFKFDWITLLIAFVIHFMMYGKLYVADVTFFTLVVIVCMLIEYKLWPGNFITPH